jgi:hypothetical protein
MIKLKAKLLQANHEAGIMDQIIATGVKSWAEGLVKGEAAGWSDCEVYCKVPSKKKASPDDVFMAEDLQERIQDLQDRMGRIKILKLIPWISVSTKDMADRERIPDEMLKHVHSERVKVPLQKVETDQEYISASKLNDLLNCPGILYKIAPPMAIRMPSGRYLIEDGNHRVVAALLEGADFLEMTVVDYRDVAQKRIAKLLKKAELNDAGCRVEALDGPYVLEGAHRLCALFTLGKTEFPALVVLDGDGGPGGGKESSLKTAAYSKAWIAPGPLTDASFVDVDREHAFTASDICDAHGISPAPGATPERECEIPLLQRGWIRAGFKHDHSYFEVGKMTQATLETLQAVIQEDPTGDITVEDGAKNAWECSAQEFLAINRVGDLRHYKHHGFLVRSLPRKPLRPSMGKSPSSGDEMKCPSRLRVLTSP